MAKYELSEGFNFQFYVYPFYFVEISNHKKFGCCFIKNKYSAELRFTEKKIVSD